MFYLEMISHFVGEGDIVLHAPELDSVQAGSNVINPRLYQAVESYYNCFDYVDISRYANVFSSLKEFNEVRREAAERHYLDFSGMIYDHGDRVNSDTLNKPTYHAGSTLNYRKNAYSQTNLNHLNEVYALIRAAGAEMYFTPAPCNRNALSENAKKESVQREYMDWLRGAISVPVIGDLWDYILDGEYMYNSDWHPNTIGRDIRTRKLYEQLMTYRKEAGLS